ncbi:MAG TPA: sugar ABC transporter permease [Lachnospiraceae bacterium]|jgi:raffinose/stachyose/melibiose transport system permease protein|nr:sugar ABC transporter permease [Lachnospiraceae bacterium]HBY70883.1 sugar ABC transporter permease [Lachnospiraceae bacterium]HCA70944.1 sugar ABC transporter permease [Lachnospiraceae bacterium]HCR39939.1 sugar ABC transporter permease [Lachnospiraceae bacterium]
MNRKKLYPWYFTIGALVIFLLLCFLPGLIGILYSFTDWNNFTSEVNFVGLKNYKEVFAGNSEYTKYIVNTIVFTVVTTIMKTVAGLALALLLTQKFIKFKTFHRMVIFSPQVMSYLVVGLVFKSMLHPTTGFVNNFLRSIGLGSLARNWLTDLKLVFPTVMAVDTWKGMGYIMVVIIAGVLSISPDYYEAASIDGASFWQKFRSITLPLLKPIIVNVTVLNVTYGLRVFDMIYSLTNGGPGNATGVINTAVYKEFSKGNFAMGTTLSSILFLFVLCLLYFIIKSMENKEVDL